MYLEDFVGLGDEGGDAAVLVLGPNLRPVVLAPHHVDVSRGVLAKIHFLFLNWNSN